MQVPEERVPWEPEKPPITRRSRSVPPQKLQKLPTISERKTKTMDVSPKKQRAKSHKCFSTSKKTDDDEDFRLSQTGERILITRGNLKLSVNFPADSVVKFLDGKKERVLLANCCCKNRKV